MKETRLEGKVSFVQHEKEYVTIEYTAGGRKRTINGKVDEATQSQWISEHIVKKPHRFHEGDEVVFTVARSERGDKNIAERIVFRFNNALSNLIHRASLDNQFTGYLKKVGDRYFVKETTTYFFFPLLVSPWEILPEEDRLNEPVLFGLENTANSEKTVASLLKPRFIPEFIKAKKYFENKTVIDAIVAKVTPHAIQVNVIGDKIVGKIPLGKIPPENSPGNNPLGGNPPFLKPSDPIKVIITHLSKTRIVLSKA